MGGRGWGGGGRAKTFKKEQKKKKKKGKVVLSLRFRDSAGQVPVAELPSVRAADRSTLFLVAPCKVHRASAPHIVTRSNKKGEGRICLW